MRRRAVNIQLPDGAFVQAVEAPHVGGVHYGLSRDDGKTWWHYGFERCTLDAFAARFDSLRTDTSVSVLAVTA